MSLNDGLEESNHGLCHPCASAALDEALEVLAPFAFHGKALGAHKGKKNLKVISKVGVSALVLGAFGSAYYFFRKYNPKWK
jgi:hypothetical protein